MIKLNWILTIAFVALSACTNISELSSKATNTLTNPALTANTTSYTHTVQSVNITALTTGSPPDLSLALSVTSGSLPLTQFCDGAATKPCSCELSWTEINTVGGTSASLSRTKKLGVSTVQSSLVKCTMTQSFWNEIANGTTMRINIIGVSPNTSGISVKSVGYKKGTTIAPTGDFVDDTLTPFRNIYRYTCYSKEANVSHELRSQVVNGTYQIGNNTYNYTTFSASTVCAQGASACDNTSTRIGYSAQSYYRNLFIRSDKLGEINSTNAHYDCPKVFESISNRATNPVSVPVGETPKYWPLDTTFAVATAPTTEWSVQIPAASVLMKTGDTTAVDDPGISPTSTDRLKERATQNGGIAWKIMGYGKKPNANGTCGSIVDSNGRNRPLTRLRRYRTVYPSTFQSIGLVTTGFSPEADQVYVADRLVADVNGNLTGNMIYGPKPCNFSWFDHEGVTNRVGGALNQDFKTHFKASIPTYKATSEFYLKDYMYPTLTGVNISVNPDGRVFPNIDRDGATNGLTPGSCSAAISLYDSDPTGVVSRARLVTTYYNRSDYTTIGGRKLYLGEIHLNPIERWSPDYVEDTSFQACVPIADPYLEPPLHFYRDSAANGGNVAWCAKVYPTQNPYWLDLNQSKITVGATIGYKAVNWGTVTAGYTNEAWVKWFTSHINSGVGLDIHNANPSCTSTSVDKICEWSLGSAAAPDYANCVSYLGNAVSTAGATNNRCDRSVMADANQDYRGFPLQASDHDTKEMLKHDLSKDKNYSCSFSVHSNPNKVNKDQPISNCCGVKSGISILDEATNKLKYDTNDNEGHLEPYLNPAFPNIRYCGNPVE